MNFEVIGHEVLKVEEISTERQAVIIKTHYDFVKHTEIACPDIVQVGQEIQIVVTCKNYLDEVLLDEETPVLITVNGLQNEYTPSSGTLTFTFISDLTGEFNIETTVPLWRNDKKKIKVV